MIYDCDIFPVLHFLHMARNTHCGSGGIIFKLTDTYLTNKTIQIMTLRREIAEMSLGLYLTLTDIQEVILEISEWLFHMER